MTITERGISLRTKSSQNIRIDTMEREENLPDSVRCLALRIAGHGDLMADVLAEIRAKYGRNKDSFFVSLAGKSQRERELVLDILDNMSGIVSNVHYDESSRAVTGKLVMTPRARNFAIGDYLEIAVFERTREIVRSIAFRHGLPYRVCKNVHVRTKSGVLKNEFDTLIVLGEHFYVLEMKSGKNCDYDKYAQIGAEYGIVPDRFLLVDVTLSDDQVENIQYFCDYYVTNMRSCTFSGKVTAMLEKDLEERELG